MYVCMRVCMRVCMYVCMHKPMYIIMFVIHTYIHTYIHGKCVDHVCGALLYVYFWYMCMYMYEWTHEHNRMTSPSQFMYVCMYVCLYVCLYVRTYVCIYVCTCLNGHRNTTEGPHFYMYEHYQTPVTSVCTYVCMHVHMHVARMNVAWIRLNDPTLPVKLAMNLDHVDIYIHACMHVLHKNIPE
jgi:hypothetical protein